VVRLLLLLREIAERWGRVVADGVWIPFRLSHDLLADLACAQRPSVSVAVRELAERGLAVRRDDGGWLLPGVRGDRDGDAPRREGAELTAQRRELYRALIEAVASFPGTLADAADAERATAELAERYAAAPRALRRRIDAALDAVEAGLPPGSFAAMDEPERVDHLRTSLEPASGSGQDAVTDAPAAHAVALAAAPFDPRGFHWSPRTVELWLRTVSRPTRTP
jgi:hypothetical protein